MRRTLAAAAALSALGLLTACGGGGSDASAPSRATSASSATSRTTGSTSTSEFTTGGSTASSPAPSATPSGTGARSAVVPYAAPRPVATARGTVDVYPDENPHVTLEVLSLRASAASTMLQLRIVPDGSISQFKSWAWSEDWRCPDRFTLVDKPHAKVYRIGQSAVPGADGKPRGCLSEDRAGSASHDRPYYQYGYYGPLPKDTRTMTLRVKGFPDTAVPVTWG